MRPLPERIEPPSQPPTNVGAAAALAAALLSPAHQAQRHCERACVLEDDFSVINESFEEAKAELVALRQDTNFVAVMRAKGAHRQEKDQRLLLEAQLLSANSRIQELLSSNAAERREGRHASEMVKQAHIDQGEALRRQLSKKVCRSGESNKSSV